MLIISAAGPDQFPPESLPEVAFLGRSNSGKSSLLNCLTGVKGLARTGSRPGCTQEVNFYRVEGGFHFVDLPGYGYAQAPLAVRTAWRRPVEEYLARRGTLLLCLLLVDARHGWTERDLELKRWLELHQRRYLVVAAKMDKLKSRYRQQQSLAAIRHPLAESEPVGFSAVSGQGVREIWQAIWKTRNQ